MRYETMFFMQDSLKKEGTPVLDNKLYLQDFKGDIILETLIPIEKIEFMARRGNMLEIRVFPSAIASCSVFLSSRSKRSLRKLALDIAAKVHMKKRFFLDYWYGDIYIR
ncbi:MAG TPA: hypothetical protein PKN36_06200 [bacterium]|nr:hypothetical protein [bacterium]